MDISGLLLPLLIFTVITPSGCSVSETAEPHCEDSDVESYNLIEGEAFYFVPYILEDSNIPDEEIIWYKNDSKIEPVSTDRNETVHYHGGALLFLNLTIENSGFYVAWHNDSSGQCYNYYVIIDVFNARMSPKLYEEIENSDLNKEMSCPGPVSYICETLEGKFTWRKDFEVLQGPTEAEFWVYNTTKDDEGIYTCTCTWTYNHKVYKSSGSRRLIVKDQSAHSPPKIISPTDEELFADKGLGIKLNCSVFCGTNVEHYCRASWEVNGIPANQKDGYNQTMKVELDNPTKNTISTAVLTIEKVSAKDFQTEFTCIGEGLYRTVSKTFTLKQRESIIPLVAGGVCALFFCLLAGVLVKCFAIDLVLFFRRCSQRRNHNKDGRIYDAYVVYQMQSMDKAAEDALCQFITKCLPSVLEKKCGYRLFIHGRDDIPGEDHLELVEHRMRQSRRLMVILTPGSGSESEITDHQRTSPRNSVIGGFDWQVGLHHALVQREMSVILIQIGDTGPEGYTHLPPGLQHLIRKSAPIRWPEGSRSAVARNSRFWKRVRYLMPATPANKCQQSDII